MIGLIGKKLGMTQIFDEKGVLSPVTVIEVQPNMVIDLRDEEKNGYNAVVLGAIDGKLSRLSKPVAGQFKAGLKPKKFLMEVRDFAQDCQIGDTFGVEILKNLRFVDVVGTSKGKGYQGVMKRYNFRGGRKTHGSKFHRTMGSSGMAASPSKVIKGTKMPGRMGGERKTVQNLRLLKVDDEKNVLLITGAVPGPRDGIVFVRQAKKRK